MKKVKPSILSGFVELLPNDQLLFNEFIDKIRYTYESFGYLPMDTPIIEKSEILLAKAGGETEKQIYRFNKGDNDLSLRFDLTVPLARYVSEHFGFLTFPFKRYQIGKVYRGERPQAGRFREFYQCDIDVLGLNDLSLVYDAEMVAVIESLFRSLDIGEFVIRINNRKILNGFFSSFDLSISESEILRIVDKIDKIGKKEVEKELSDLKIDNDIILKIIDFITFDGSNKEKIEFLNNLNINNELFKKGIKELEETFDYLEKFQVPTDSYKLDFSIARGLDYYTGTVYETNLVNYPSLGSVCSGGRYENLASYYSNESMVGVGISIGLTRLFYLLKREDIIKSENNTLLDILIIPTDMKYIQNAIEISSKLRGEGLNVDTFYLDKPLAKKLNYANKLGIPMVGLVGDDEVKNSSITLKNMISGVQETISLDEFISSLGGCDCED